LPNKKRGMEKKAKKRGKGKKEKGNLKYFFQGGKYGKKGNVWDVFKKLASNHILREDERDI